ncbi:hypothetical protein S7711_01424 [Stachybotrys chartarum IBT 7711]|uniref:Gfo/Idh/MocA-like oxidoreductase N-terminal domain-containing protein n=1 Tax=Stachybotrys chartarum (strain CBS 109288 / IBT 7711) TaxID=1280523 RepID=A0A084B6X6_STACB|nr:hypothetical protein S7711_01424 [Stachybotrys chartarum IBT 7711]KFA55061.1 hypothetical protein S40293_03554 [Stachybotrys chartarum IBT 40293]KFA77750.1 hypothetical protein S40288_00452 [Stachybotrys chartarum IBT 40288]
MGGLNVLMVGTGEYTTGFIGTGGSASDKKIGVVGLTLFDLRRRGKVGELGMVGVNGTKFPAIREHLDKNITQFYNGLDTSFQSFPANDKVDADAYKTAIDQLKPGDAITIFTPDPSHYPIALYAIERGIHVLVTKPAVKLLEHHQELIARANEKRVFVMVEHHKRFDPVYSDARFRAQKLGDFNYYYSYMAQPKLQLETFKAWAGKDSDISYYLNSHHVDILDSMISQRGYLPVKVDATASKGVATSLGCVEETEDTISLLTTWVKDGDASKKGIAVFTSSWTAPNRSGVHTSQNFHYLAAGGELRVDQSRRGYDIADDSVGYVQWNNPFYMRYAPDEDGNFQGATGYGYISIEKFVDNCRAINEGTTTLEELDNKGLPTLKNTVATTAILEAGRRSIDEGREVGIVVENGVWKLVAPRNPLDDHTIPKQPTTMAAPHHSELIFPSQPTFNHVLGALRRSTLSVHNRLASIRDDAAFVARVAAALGPGRPLVANERCGSWYVPPGDKAASAYFKSTDGHERQWKFSTRRLNLHLLELVERHDGIIIVDSTRRGKRMPDALSTTIPIWCTVLNLALLPHNPLSRNLFLPPHHAPSIHAQVDALIPSFLSSFLGLQLSLPTTLTKPLRPFWITQDTALGDEPVGDIYEEYRPVVCCTASRRVVGSEIDEGGYIQGAADDTENWAHGLTAQIFWEYAQQLLETPEAELPDLIAHLIQQTSATDLGSRAEARKELTQYISVSPLPLNPTPGECHIALTQEATNKETWIKSPIYMEAGLGKSKSASRNLRLALPQICNFAAKFLNLQQIQDGPGGKLIVACDSGKDLSVATALAIDCYLFDDDGKIRAPDDRVSFTKGLIKIRLANIMTRYPEANPNRGTLQSVNSFLMDWRN